MARSRAAICSKWYVPPIARTCTSVLGGGVNVVVHAKTVVRIVDGLDRTQSFERRRGVRLGDVPALLIGHEVHVGLARAVHPHCGTEAAAPGEMLVRRLAGRPPRLNGDRIAGAAMSEGRRVGGDARRGAAHRD